MCSIHLQLFVSELQQNKKTDRRELVNLRLNIQCQKMLNFQRS